MDVKSDFLNGFINEDIFVEQPQGFENHNFSNGLQSQKDFVQSQATLRAWYERLKTFLLENGFEIFFLLVKEYIRRGKECTGLQRVYPMRYIKG